jgi:anti-sigma regulatory factor (Ser/Thr protein kinase)
MTAPGRAGVGREQTHVVGVYGREVDLVDAVAAYLGDALLQRGSAIVVATADHRAALAAALEAAGHSVDALTATGHYRALDARDTLATFMLGDRPDPVAFASAIGDVLRAAPIGDGPVHVFGEMVALLWDEGNVEGAIELETHWNAIAAHHSFALFCAYAMSSLEASGDLAAAKQMCDRHTCVMTWEPALTHPHAEPTESVESAVPVPDAERMFVAAPSVIPRVRAFVRDALHTWGADDDQSVDDAELVASELATNAVKHAGSPFRVSLSMRADATRVAVRDTSFDPPRRVDRNVTAFGGRGIDLVAAVSDSWGVQAESDGKTVWALIARA